MVALTFERWPTHRMVDTSSYEAAERARAGAALKILRKRSGLSQEKAASIAGIGTQTWQNYEVGRRGMDLGMLGRVTSAIGATVEEHALIMARTASPDTRPASAGFAERQRSFEIPVGGIAYGGAPRQQFNDGEADIIDFSAFFKPTSRVLRNDGMSMWPYAKPGGLVTYDLRVPPKRGEGCVVELNDGSYLLKLFQRYEGDALIVSEIYPEERELDPIPLQDVRGVYAIGLRGD